MKLSFFYYFTDVSRVNSDQTGCFKGHSWTEDFEFVCLCTSCWENVACWTSSVSWHFETKHNKTEKDNTDSTGSIKRAVSKDANQASSLKLYTTSKNAATEASFCIAKHGKQFTDGEFINDAFLCYTEALFGTLTNKETIKILVEDIHISQKGAAMYYWNVWDQQIVWIKTQQCWVANSRAWT